MKLFYSPNSPYARIARITLRECALENHVEEVAAANRSADNPLLDYCPVGRVPTLIDGDLKRVAFNLVHLTDLSRLLARRDYRCGTCTMR